MGVPIDLIDTKWDKAAETPSAPATSVTAEEPVRSDKTATSAGVEITPKP